VGKIQSLQQVAHVVTTAFQIVNT